MVFDRSGVGESLNSRAGKYTPLKRYKNVKEEEWQAFSHETISVPSNLCPVWINLFFRASCYFGRKGEGQVLRIIAVLRRLQK